MPVPPDTVSDVALIAGLSKPGKKVLGWVAMLAAPEFPGIEQVCAKTQGAAKINQQEASTDESQRFQTEASAMLLTNLGDMQSSRKLFKTLRDLQSYSDLKGSKQETDQIVNKSSNL